MRKYLLIAVVSFAFLLYLYAVAIDTSMSRRFYVQKTQALVTSAKSTKDPTSIIRRLIDETHNPIEFRAIYAAASLGHLGDAAEPFAETIARRLHANRRGVSQEIARSLSDLGPHAVNAVPLMEQYLKQKNLPTTTTWIVIDALGKIGESTPTLVPLLQSFDGMEPEMFRGTVQSTIENLIQKARLDGKSI